jgi:hypothetical protein
VRPTTFRQIGSKRMTFPTLSGGYLPIATSHVAADRDTTISPKSSATLDGVEHAHTGAIRNADARGNLSPRRSPMSTIAGSSTPHETLSQQKQNDLATAIELLAKLRTRFDKLGGPSSLVHGASMQAQIDLMRDVDAFLAAHRASSAR